LEDIKLKESPVRVKRGQLFERIVKKMNIYFCYLGMGMLMLLMLVGTFDVIGRYLFDTPLTGAMEASTVLLAGIVFFGLMHVQSIGGNVKVDVLTSHFSPKAKFVSDLVGCLLGLFLFSLMGWEGLKMAIIYWKAGRLVDVVNIPIAYFQLFVPIGSFILCLEFILEIRKLLLQRKVLGGTR
jgi:TRAP-type C4-dicarboxylate transport system permease small subunit